MVIEGSRSQFLICYASEKGTAQGIAEDLSEQCMSYDLKNPCHLSCISEIRSINRLQDFCCVIFIGSTTGDGDPPETARKFMRELKTVVSEISLCWLHYTILGLGDTNYTNFCNFGKTLDRLLKNGKALRFYDCGWADDGTGLEIVIEPWIEGLFPVLKKFLDSPLAKRTELITAEPNILQINSLPVDTNNLVVMAGHDISLEVNSDDRLSVEDLRKLLPSLNLPDDDAISVHSVKKLKLSFDDKLTLPNNPISYLLTEYSNETLSIDHKDVIIKDKVIKYPATASDIFSCHITSCRRLTTDDAVKETLEITLQSSVGDQFIYEPGDSFGIIVSNRVEEVELVLRLLQVYYKADMRIRLKLDPATTKRVASVPKYIPEDCTLRYIFTHCLDIRTVPKKLFLRALVEHTSETVEKRRLMELVSKEGSEEYNEIVRAQGLTFLDLLILFPSCLPPISLVCEHLPRLLPRPYSITSSPLVSPEVISFVFNIIKIPHAGAVTFSREGLCTGWLNSLTRDKINGQEDDIDVALAKLSLENNTEDILIYFRSNQNFRLPKEVTLPLIMIGPGTGVAPFIGFLKHREAQIKESKTDTVPDMRLFYGCRHEERDYLYKGELLSFTESGILKELFVSFSRDEKHSAEPKYVQGNLTLHGDKIVDLISNQNAAIYVCGDAKNMSRNVFDTFVSLLQKHSQLTELDARKFIAQMQMSNRYMQDVWA